MQDLDLAILQVLWLDLNKIGLSRQQIVEALEKRGIVRSGSAVKVRIQKLRNRPIHRPISVTKSTHGRELYRINRDEMITWSSTAKILMVLWNLPEQAMKYDIFVQKILDFGIHNKTTDQPFVRDDLNRQLEFARDQGYVTYINTDCLIPDKRIEDELEFLRFIAGNP